jgi:aldose 1-epimerase
MPIAPQGLPELEPFRTHAPGPPRFERERVEIPDHGPSDVVTLHAGGVHARVLGFGATLAALQVPDAHGGLQHVVLGFDDPARYAGEHPYFGSTVGRFANRIARSRFTLDGVEYTLPPNDGPNHLHGGAQGFHRKLFEARPFADDDQAGVELSYVSPDGEGGYPARVELRVTYLHIDYVARVDGPTVLNLTNHSYFNLRDGGATPVLDHVLWLAAERALEIDAQGIPTGALAAVHGGALDFTTPRALGERVDALSDRGGYDHCVLSPLHEGGEPQRVACLYDPASGRMLEVWTTQPALQIYSGNGLDGSLAGHGGTRYPRRSALCLETQHCPDAPNHPAFATTRVAPPARYAHSTIYRFGHARA